MNGGSVGRWSMALAAGLAAASRSDRRGSDLARSGEIDGHLVSLVAETSFAAAQYRHLSQIVEQTGKAGVLAVCSAGVGEGKTTTAINLAGALAQTPGTRVLLLEIDLRRPMVEKRLGLPQQRGVTDLITDPALDLDAVVRTAGPHGLSFIGAGRSTADPYHILQSSHFPKVIERACERYDRVVLDTAPLLPTPDWRVITRCSTGILLVVAAHKTERRLLEDALNALEPDKVLGIVFNGDEQPVSRYHRHYSAYYEELLPAAPTDIPKRRP